MFQKTSFILFVLIIISGKLLAQNNDNIVPWSENQLLSPKELAEKITNHQSENLIVISIGPDALIKESIDIGPTKDKDNLKKLEDYLGNLDKDKEVVIYCGCCPFANCPNIRPAFETLKEMGFKNGKLLNLSTNIKVDWIDKDYPLKD